MPQGSTNGARVRISVEMICPYEPGKPIEEVKRELGLTRIVKLASNENPLGPSRHVVDTLNSSDLELHLYPDYEGWYLRRALAEQLGVTEQQLVTGAGSAELMRLVADAYLERDDEGIVADICFPVYANVIRIAGATPVEVPLDDKLDYDLERMLGAVTPRTKAVFLASPNNPTGRRIPRADLVAFVERLPERVLCVLDLAYWEYVAAEEGEEPLRLVADHPNVILLRTFSKVYGLAGLRIGYAVAHPDVIHWLCRVRLPFSTSTAAQVAARAGLEDQAHVQRSVALNRQGRAALAHELSELGFPPHSSEANFVLVDFRTDAEGLFQALLRRGIIVRPMRHPRLTRCVRITTGTEEQMGMLLEAVRAELC